MSGLRLVVDAPIDNLRERLEGAYFGFFQSIELPADIDAEAVQDLVEVVPAGSAAPLDLSQVMKNGDDLTAWLQAAKEDTLTSIHTEAARDPLNLAILLFSPGVPCVALSQIHDDTVELIDFRSSHPAFSGVFSFAPSNVRELLLHWDLGIEFARLQVNLQSRRGTISHSSPDGKESFEVPYK